MAIELFGDVSLLKDVQVCVVGKVFKPNRMKVLALNRTRGTSKACHRCGHFAREHGREMRCLKCGLRYNRDLNACINIAHALTRDMGWGSRKSPNQQMWLEAQSLQANAGNLKGGVDHI